MTTDIILYMTLLANIPMRKPGFWNLGGARDNLVVSNVINSTTLKAEVKHELPTPNKITHNTKTMLDGLSDAYGFHSKTVALVKEETKSIELRNKA